MVDAGALEADFEPLAEAALADEEEAVLVCALVALGALDEVLRGAGGAVGSAEAGGGVSAGVPAIDWNAPT